MKKLINITLVLLMVFSCLGCRNKEDKDISADRKEDNLKTMEMVDKVVESFEKLKNYDGKVKINELRGNMSHADQDDIANGILEQTKFKITLNPLKNEGEFWYGTSMYNIIDGSIWMNKTIDELDLTYENLLKDYVDDDKPYQFTLKNNVITKSDKAPPFYCEETTKGSYYGKTRNDTENYVTDSFTIDDVGDISLGLGGGLGNAKLFNWIEKTYLREISQFIPNEIGDGKMLSVESSNNNQNIKIKYDISKLSPETKNSMLNYLSHGTEGIWELSEFYISVELDDEGYPASYEKMEKAKHIADGTIIPLYTKTTFERN